ncbi:MAG: FAD-binding domain-containing protein [Armatimonadota bacterium]
MHPIELPLANAERSQTLQTLLDVREQLPFTGYDLSPWLGGRTEGLRRLAAFDVSAYARTRNIVGPDSGVSLLGPYIRHGLITLTECRTAAIRKSGGNPPVKFLQELAWREYYQRVYAQLGDVITHTNLESPKVELGNRPLPDDIRFGTTGLACMDENINMLRETGYMYNHARMWVASYIIHHRKVAWQHGARMFLQHLLDGDPASNSLGWQWIASTYSHKPYLFDQGNVQRFSDHCKRCPSARNGSCPFRDYIDIPPSKEFARPLPMVRTGESKGEDLISGNPDVVWVHGDHIDVPANAALARYPDVPAVFILDTTLAASRKISLKRFAFLYESVSEAFGRHPAGGRIVVGDPADVLTSIDSCKRIATTMTPSGRFAEICADIEAKGIAVNAITPPRFVPDDGPVPNRFMKWWKVVEDDVLTLQPRLLS